MPGYEVAEFDWDEGNRNKSLLKHGVTNEEAEEAFFDDSALIFRTRGDRYVLFGKTSGGMHLFQVFEFRGYRIRIISSRPMTVKEKRLYRQG